MSGIFWAHYIVNRVDLRQYRRGDGHELRNALELFFLLLLLHVGTNTAAEK